MSAGTGGTERSGSTERAGSPDSTDSPDYEAALQAFAGVSGGPGHQAPDPVNVPMIRHWVEAMGDENPVYLDDDAAREAGFPGIVAPPTMLQAWIMRGLKVSREVEAARAAGAPSGDSPSDRVMALLDEGGYTSVVATNCDQRYLRPLVPGDRLSVESVTESVSPPKTTGLGVGRFLTNRLDFTDQHGELVATMRFRILKFRPRQPTGADDGTRTEPQEAVAPPAPEEAPGRPLRPRPALTQDNRFFFEGTRRGELLIQRCADCGTLRHPPRPACGACRSFAWDTVRSSGRGSVYSFVVNHHPQVPAFDYPLTVALVELEEGTRLVANVAGFAPGEMVIGAPVRASFEAFDDELTLPVFRPDGDGERHPDPDGHPDLDGHRVEPAPAQPRSE